MLVPAILYKRDIEERIQMRYYTDELFYFLGGPGATTPNIVDVDDAGTNYQYACIIDDTVEGYFGFSYNPETKCIHSITAYRFGNHKFAFARDVVSMLLRVLNTWDVHKVEWCCIEGNKAKPMYDKFMKKLGGSQNILYHRDVVKDKYGTYHGCYYYEVIYNE